MPELRKLLKLAPNAFAITIPAKYRNALKLEAGNYVSIWLYDEKSLMIRKHEAPEKL